MYPRHFYLEGMAYDVSVARLSDAPLVSESSHAPPPFVGCSILISFASARCRILQSQNNNKKQISFQLEKDSQITEQTSPPTTNVPSCNHVQAHRRRGSAIRRAISRPGPKPTLAVNTRDCKCLIWTASTVFSLINTLKIKY